jgi:hypothetical protein
MKLQEEGLDTVEANLALGHPADARDYRVAAEILHDLGVRSVRLLSNNPRKSEALERHGVTVAEQVPLLMEPSEENLAYLLTKRERLTTSSRTWTAPWEREVEKPPACGRRPAAQWGVKTPGRRKEQPRCRSTRTSTAPWAPRCSWVSRPGRLTAAPR